MKHAQRLTAFLLAAAMACTITGTALATGLPVPRDQWNQTEYRQPTPDRSRLIRHSIRPYEEEEMVRAIVVLDGKPEIQTARDDRKLASGLRTALMDEHRKVLERMKDLKFHLACEFTSVLNGFALDIPYGQLDFLAQLPGVRTVRIATSYDVPETQSVQPLSMVAGAYNGNLNAAAAGYNGAGQVIAIIDTGLDVSHEAFQDVDGLCAASAVLTQGNRSPDTAPGCYLSSKVPFAYDYADRDSDVNDVQGHGTHVAGIAAGYACSEEEGSVRFQGAAPAAQLVILKVFGDRQPSTDDSIIFKALDDAYRLGADVVNLSLGSPHGFIEEADDNTDLFESVYEGLDEAGILVNCSAGNSGSQSDQSTKGYLGAEYNDHGTVGDPASKNGNLSVASMENAKFPYYAIVVNGQPFLYGDTTITALDEVGDWRRAFAGQETPFAVVPGADGGMGIGTSEEIAAANLNGKIAVVRRGLISFQEKADHAAAAGAIGLIVVNTEPGLIGMKIEPGGIPAVSVVQEAEEVFVSLGSGTLLTPEEKVVVGNPDAFRMSSFSSWGTTSSLSLDPAITSFGGSISSAAAGMDHEYVVMSGTSMSAPMMSGTAANVLSFLDQIGFDGSGLERARLAEELLLSSASIAPDGDSFFSVRRQGAGLANASSAIANHQHAGYIPDPLKELGDDPEKTGVYRFDVMLKNTTSETVHYDHFQSIVLTDTIENIGSADQPVYANQNISTLLQAEDASAVYALNGTAVDALDLAPGESAVLTVTIRLSDSAKSGLDRSAYGAFVEGFVTFTANEQYETHATFLAYYGDWTEAPILETADFRDYLSAAYQLTQLPGDEAGHSMAELGVQPEQVLGVHTMPNLAFTVHSTLLGKQTGIDLPGANLFEQLPFRPEYAAFSTSRSNHALANGIQILPYLLRNASELRMIFSNSETGEIYKTVSLDDYPNVRAVYDPQNQFWASAVYENWDGKAANRKMVPSGTKVNVRLDAVLPYGHNGEPGTLQENAWNFDITVDNTAPELDLNTIVMDPASGTMTVTASDTHYLQAIVLKDDSKTELDTITGRHYYDAQAFAPEAAGETCTAVFDIQPLLNRGIEEVHVMAMDYATNMTEISVSLIRKNQPAALTLNQPLSEPLQYAFETGDSFVFPVCEDVVEGARFICWTLEPLEHVSPEKFDQLPQFYPGEQIVITGNAAYYALYAFGTEQPLETTRYAMDRIRGTYAGEFAIVGMNSANGSFDSTRPMALGQNLATVSLADQENVTVDPEHIAFSTDDPAVRFLVESVGYGLYTIRNAADQSYLAMNSSNELEISDTFSEGAVWNITAHKNTPYAVQITNSVNSDMMLLYYPKTQSMELKAKYYVVGRAPNGTQLLAEDILQVWLFPGADSDYTVRFFTTSAEEPQHEHQWDTGTVTKAPSCTEPGVMTFTCSICGESRDEEIPALGHDWDEGQVTRAPTQTEEGERTFTCRRCGQIRVEPIPVLEPEHHPDYFSEFSDCSQEWYHEAVNYMVHNGLMTGVGDRHFAPSAGMTRSMVVQVLYRHAGSPEVEKPSGFADVDADAWYSEAVAWAKANDVVAGIGGNRFGPDMQITREQIAVILWSSQSRPEASCDLSAFRDSSRISDYAGEAMKWAVSEGLFAGDDNSCLNPGRTASRAEFAVILLRYLDGSYEVTEQ